MPGRLECGPGVGVTTADHITLQVAGIREIAPKITISIRLLVLMLPFDCLQLSPTPRHLGHLTDLINTAFLRSRGPAT